MASTTAQDTLRRSMFGHGSLMILSSLIGAWDCGVIFWVDSNSSPATSSNFSFQEIPMDGSAATQGRLRTASWSFSLAWDCPTWTFPIRLAEWLGWIVMMDGWSNVGFYFFGNLSPNRGLSFGTSRLGPLNIFSVLALGPAYLFGVLAMGAFASIGHHALVGGKVPKTTQNGIHQKS